VTGANTVIWAIQAGHQAADDLDNSIRTANGEPLYKAPPEEVIEIPFEFDEETEERPQCLMPELDISKRQKGFKEVELGYSKADAIQEAIRCLRCDAEIS